MDLRYRWWPCYHRRRWCVWAALIWGKFGRRWLCAVWMGGIMSIWLENISENIFKTHRDSPMRHRIRHSGRWLPGTLEIDRNSRDLHCCRASKVAATCWSCQFHGKSSRGLFRWVLRARRCHASRDSSHPRIWILSHDSDPTASCCDRRNLLWFNLRNFREFTDKTEIRLTVRPSPSPSMARLRRELAVHSIRSYHRKSHR